MNKDLLESVNKLVSKIPDASQEYRSRVKDLVLKLLSDDTQGLIIDDTLKIIGKLSEQTTKSSKVSDNRPDRETDVFGSSSNNTKKIIVRDRGHLKELIAKEIKEHGYNCNLNHLDVSGVKNMYSLFSNSKFNGDISNWDVSGVTYMGYMFANSEFNGDISNWDVNNVENMNGMFANSNFDGDISKWDVSNVKSMSYMFTGSSFTGDILSWDVSNVKFTNNVLERSKYKDVILGSNNSSNALNKLLNAGKAGDVK